MAARRDRGARRRGCRYAGSGERQGVARDSQKSIIDADAAQSESVHRSLGAAVAAVTNARHRKMLELILGEMKEHLRVLSRRPRAASDLLGRHSDGKVLRGTVMAARPKNLGCASPFPSAATSAIAARTSTTRSTRCSSTSPTSRSRRSSKHSLSASGPSTARTLNAARRRADAASGACAAGSPAGDRGRAGQGAALPDGAAHARSRSDSVWRRDRSRRTACRFLTRASASASSCCVRWQRSRPR